MAYLCSRLQAADIKLILDFGRGPDAYSSIVLNEYVNQNNEVSYFSVDWNDFSDKEFFGKNQWNSKSKFLVGNAFDVMPSFIKEASLYKGKVAVVIDGPKHKDQVLLALLAIRFLEPKILALHNIYPVSIERMQVDPSKRGKYYEEFEILSNSFKSLLSVDISKSRRSIEQSSLLVLESPDELDNLSWSLKVQLSVLSLGFLFKRNRLFCSIYAIIVWFPRTLLSTWRNVSPKFLRIRRKLKKTIIVLLHPIYKFLRNLGISIK